MVYSGGGGGGISPVCNPDNVPLHTFPYPSLDVYGNSSVVRWQGDVSEKNPLPWPRDARGDAQDLLTLLPDAQTRPGTAQEEN